MTDQTATAKAWQQLQEEIKEKARRVGLTELPYPVTVECASCGETLFRETNMDEITSAAIDSDCGDEIAEWEATVHDRITAPPFNSHPATEHEDDHGQIAYYCPECTPQRF